MTFPLSFAEVIWGDDQSGRQIMSATDLSAFGTEALQHSVRRERQGLGAICRLGFRG